MCKYFTLAKVIECVIASDIFYFVESSLHFMMCFGNRMKVRKRCVMLSFLSESGCCVIVWNRKVSVNVAVVLKKILLVIICIHHFPCLELHTVPFILLVCKDVWMHILHWWRVFIQINFLKEHTLMTFREFSIILKVFLKYEHSCDVWGVYQKQGGFCHLSRYQ